MTSDSPLVTRTPLRLTADPRRVLAQLFVPGQELMVLRESRSTGVLARIAALDGSEVATTLAGVHARYAGRHRDLPGILQRHWLQVAHRVPAAMAPDADRRELVGARFTLEYALEGAALFNPSVVAHPDQTGLDPGWCRLLLSLRAVGEGHLSSVEFRTGLLGPAGELSIDDPGRRVESGTVTETAEDCYQVEFDPATQLSERVLWPQAPAESHGMEDVRLVRFDGDDADGGVRYLGTYTAFDGAAITLRLLETRDFRSFLSTPLTGPAAVNKGLALFPRRVGGGLAALSRWDREKTWLATSADGRRWGDPVLLDEPARPWNLIHSGNCGPPLETPAGWLVLTHGVGPMREYAIGALLLDLEDPSRVLGSLAEPLIVAAADEREGYVPNVLYSCGSLLHGDRELLPYGASDASVRFALVDLPGLLAALTG